MRKKPAPLEGRYTAARFLADCSDETYAMLRKTWNKGVQLSARKVPVDALPAVVILSAYAKDYGASLVDDHEALLQRYRDNIAECWHNDKFFASSILILADRYMSPSDEAYRSINIPTIYEELLP